MIVTKTPLCMFTRYGTRGAVIAAQRPCVLKKFNNLGAIARARGRRSMGAFVPRRRVRLGFNDSTLPPTVFNDNGRVFNEDPSAYGIDQLPIYNVPIYLTPQVQAPPAQRQPPAATNPILSSVQSWFAGSSLGVPNAVLGGGFALIVGASLLKSRGRR